MAYTIQATATFLPRLDHRAPLGPARLTELIIQPTLLGPGVIKNGPGARAKTRPGVLPAAVRKKPPLQKTKD